VLCPPSQSQFFPSFRSTCHSDLPTKATNATAHLLVRSVEQRHGQTAGLSGRVPLRFPGFSDSQLCTRAADDLPCGSKRLRAGARIRSSEGLRSACAQAVDPHRATDPWPKVSGCPVRDRLGRAGPFGRAARNPLPVFGLVRRNRAVRRTENPRVGGSIPPLATTPNSMTRIRFSASPADYGRPRGAEIDRPSDSGISGRSCRSATRVPLTRRKLANWNPRNLRGCAVEEYKRPGEFKGGTMFGVAVTGEKAQYLGRESAI
jgi:hypothetical protein